VAKRVILSLNQGIGLPKKEVWGTKIGGERLGPQLRGGKIGGRKGDEMVLSIKLLFKGVFANFEDFFPPKFGPIKNWGNPQRGLLNF